MSYTLVAKDFFNGLRKDFKEFSLDSHASRLAFKAALSAVLAAVAGMWLDVQHVYWASFSALVVTQPNAGASLVKGVYRIVGSIIGGGLGVLMVSLFSWSHLFTMAAIFCTTVGSVYLMSLARKASYAVFLGGITSVIVVIGSLRMPEEAFNIAYYRCFEVCIGIVVSLFVSLVLFPDSAGPKLKQNVIQCIDVFSELLNLVMGEYKDRQGRGDEIKDTAIRLEKHLKQYRATANFAKAERVFTREDWVFMQWAAGRVGAAKDLLMAFHVHFSAREYLYYQDNFASHQDIVAKSLTRMVATIKSIVQGEAEVDELLKDLSLFENNAENLINDYKNDRKKGNSLNYPVLDVLQFHQYVRLIRSLAGLFLVPVTEAGIKEKKIKLVRPWEIRYRPMAKQMLTNGLAMVIAPLIWIWFDFPGLAELAVSVVVMMQPDDVETERKAFLRLMGCLAGGLSGILLLGFSPVQNLMPWMIVYFSGIYFFSIINFGSSLSAYFGLQGSFALTMAFVQGNHAAISLSPPVERLVGIFLAAILGSMLTALIMPEPPLQKLKNELEVLRNLVTNLLITLDRAFKGHDHIGVAARKVLLASEAVSKQLPVAKRSAAVGQIRSRYVKRELAACRMIAEEAILIAQVADVPELREMAKDSELELSKVLSGLEGALSGREDVEDVLWQLDKDMDMFRTRALNRGIAPVKVVLNRSTLYVSLYSMLTGIDLEKKYRIKVDLNLEQG